MPRPCPDSSPRAESAPRGHGSHGRGVRFSASAAPNPFEPEFLRRSARVVNRGAMRTTPPALPRGMGSETVMSIQFERLTLVVHYVCALCSHHPARLDVQKLNTILWRTDGEAYASLGKPIVGEDYTRGAFGPTAVHLDLALPELERQGQLTIRGYGVAPEYLARRAPDVSSLTADERRILDRIIREVTGGDLLAVADGATPGGRVSRAYERSFEGSFGHTWDVAEPGESVPYQQYALLKFPPDARR